MRFKKENQFEIIRLLQIMKANKSIVGCFNTRESNKGGERPPKNHVFVVEDIEVIKASGQILTTESKFKIKLANPWSNSVQKKHE